MDQWIEKAIAAVVATVFGALGWLVRTVLTNNKKIEILEKEIATRDQRREEDRKAVQELKEDVRDLRKDLHDFLMSVKK